MRDSQPQETRRIVTVKTVNITAYELDTSDDTPVDDGTATDLFHEHIGYKLFSDECTHTVISDEAYSPEVWARITNQT